MTIDKESIKSWKKEQLRNVCKFRMIIILTVAVEMRVSLLRDRSKRRGMGIGMRRGWGNCDLFWGCYNYYSRLNLLLLLLLCMVWVGDFGWVLYFLGFVFIILVLINSNIIILYNMMPLDLIIIYFL